MPTPETTAQRPRSSKRSLRRSGLVAAVVALLAAAALAAAGCGGGSSKSPAVAGSPAPAMPASSAHDSADGDNDGGHGASDVPAAPSSSAGIPQHNGGDHDADNNGGPSDGDGNT